MDFEQWFKDHRYSDTPLCYGAAKDGFKAGQQSKQAEIDKIKELLNQWDNWISVSGNHPCIEIIKECADELRELLK